jgi:hypothetical protein
MKPKSILVLSLVLNVIFVALGGIFLRESPGRSAPGVFPEIKAAPDLAPKPQPATKATAGTVSAAVEPFRWSQLSSDDDATYIHNLRAVGCPENTIRDILGAAIGHRYDQKRQALRDQGAKGLLNAASLTEAIGESWDEQNDLLARLFGTQGTFSSGGVVARAVEKDAADAGSSMADAVRVSPMSLSGYPAPLAVLDPDPSWGLNATQLEIWNQVGEQFVESVGGRGQNPMDPAYRQRWEQAEAAANDRIRSALGDELYGRLQLQTRSLMEDAFTK